MVDPVLIPIIAVTALPIVAIGLPIARAWARRMDQKPIGVGVAPEVAARLERMEQAIDSIAIEVERISEGQRFTTKLLSERVPAPGALKGPEQG